MVDLGATSAGLPVELWVRIAVEAARIAGEIAALSDVEVAEVSAVLRDAAQQRDGGPPQLAAAGLRRYVGELSAGGRGTASAEELALRLPEEMAATWSRAAAEERIDLSRWLARRLEEAPVDCVGWEEAAAVQFRSLGEWAYASWLRSSASSNP